MTLAPGLKVFMPSRAAKLAVWLATWNLESQAAEVTRSQCCKLSVSLLVPSNLHTQHESGCRDRLRTAVAE